MVPGSLYCNCFFRLAKDLISLFSSSQVWGLLQESPRGSLILQQVSSLTTPFLHPIKVHLRSSYLQFGIDCGILDHPGLVER